MTSCFSEDMAQLNNSANVENNSDEGEDEEHTVAAASVSEVEMHESNCKGGKLVMKCCQY